jgi:phosphate acetyltransferase
MDRVVTSKAGPLDDVSRGVPAVHAELFALWTAAAAGKRVVFVESEDERIRIAAQRLAALGARPILLTGSHDPHPRADNIEVVVAGAQDRLTLAGEMLVRGEAEACVAGVVAPSPAVLRAALRTVGCAEGSTLVSSVYLMLMPDGRVLGYADCVVNPRPEPEALASIAVDSASTFTQLTRLPARVALLSFSTAGSASHPDVARVVAAARIARDTAPDLDIDGELQFDSAVVPEIARSKAPESSVAGRANVLIFPSLEAGNIGYKITERLAGAIAVGPVLQGLTKPYFDISRGSSADDVVRLALAAATMSTAVAPTAG